MTKAAPSEKKSKPLLTIAIPTYNRARFLRELLTVLFDQLISEDRVELIISDNASPDETPLVVAEFEQRGLQIRSIRNEVNVGADANFLQCYKQARGKYVWIFGDDDMIIPAGLARVLSLIAVNDYDLVYVDSFGLEDSAAVYPLKMTRMPFDTTDATLFVGRVHVFLTFISGNIINKDSVEKHGTSDIGALVGSTLAQLGWTYAALNGFRRGLHIQDRLVGARVDNTGGYKLLEVFGPTLRTITGSWVESPKLQRIIMNGALQRFWPGMALRYKSAASAFSPETAPDKVLASAYKDNFRYWVFVYPILRLPAALASCWLLLIRAINRADRALGFVIVRRG